MDFAHFVGVTTFAPNIWRTTKYIHDLLIWAKFHWKIPLEKCFFQILAEIEMTRNENLLFGRHLETVQIFYNFFPEKWLWLVYMGHFSRLGNKVWHESEIFIMF